MDTLALGNKSKFHGLKLAILSALAAAIVVDVVFLLAISRGEIAEGGLEPHFARGDRILVDRLSPALVDYRAGEVVGTDHTGKNFGIGALSRVIAVPGTTFGWPNPTSLGPDEYLLSSVREAVDDPDSVVTFTVVPRSVIHGRVILRTAPLDRFEWRPGRMPPSETVAER